MAAPTITPMVITITSSTSTYKGEKVKVWNITRKQFIIGTFNASKECIINPHNTYTEWVSGDSIQFEVNGRLQGVGTATLTKEGAAITIATTAVTESAALHTSVNL